MAGMQSGPRPETEQTGSEQTGSEQTADFRQRLKARELNELIRYTMWSVFRVSDSKVLARGSAAARQIRDAIAIEVDDLLVQAEG